MSPSVIRFGPFTLDLDAYALNRDGEALHLERIPMDLLILLARAQGALVSREQIVGQLWGDDPGVDADNAVNTAIRKIRRALADDPARPRHVETVVGKGYRLKGCEPAPAAAAGRAGAAAGRRTMLLVLPFDNLSGNPEHEYFSDGLTEEVIAHLGQFSPGHLGVIARTTSMAYKRTDKTVSQIGAEVHADYLLEGSVRREADTVRITAQLIRVHDQVHVWAQSYDRPLGSILAVQAEIGAAIADRVRPSLGAGERGRPVATAAVDAQAYDDYLRGLYKQAKLTADALASAITDFERATAREPGFAAAHCGLAHCFIRLPIIGAVASREAFGQARLAVERALQQDAGSAEAHAAVAAIRFWFDWDFAGAKAAARHAIELNANYAHGHFMLAHVCSNIGEHTEALAAIHDALGLDPLSLLGRAMLGQFLYHAGRLEESLEQLEQTLELEPRFWIGHLFVAKTCERQRRYPEALAACERALECSDGSTEALSLSAYVCAAAGERGDAARRIERLLELRRRRYVRPLDLALPFVGLGDVAAALRWLRVALRERDTHLTFLRDPKWSALRTVPQFRDVLRRVGLR